MTRITLPADAHREHILRCVRENRVTIIQGETGCGKSSRVPLILLESVVGAKMMVAQPRRIAVKGLHQRAEQEGVGHLVGMRMGGGIRDEGRQTRMWLVTTGYLVRLASGKPAAFRDHTHLIIDECHERSLDSDVLCLMARRLLVQHPHLRLVLMSATVHTEILADYFGEEVGRSHVGRPLFVGSRRFKLTECYLKEITSYIPQNAHGNRKKLEQLIDVAAQMIKTTSQGRRPGRPQSITSMISEAQLKLAASLATALIKEKKIGDNSSGGGAILMFISGITDIEILSDAFSKVPACMTLPIHSDLPFEEQLNIFEPAAGMTKVYLATNAAESSLTLPDVDVVIDLGAHKQVLYDEERKVTRLVKTWISKASATQRAGRTARVRPGTVFRLYTQKLFAVLMRVNEIPTALV